MFLDGKATHRHRPSVAMPATARERGGCWKCGVNTPVVCLEMRHGLTSVITPRGVSYSPWSRPYALCLPCLGLWFPGWGDVRVQDWLDGQVHRTEVWVRDAEVRKELDRRDLAAWLRVDLPILQQKDYNASEPLSPAC